MKKYTLLLIIIVILGYYTPVLVINKNIDTLKKEKRIFALDAINRAKFLFSGTVKGLVYTTFKVISVDEIKIKQPTASIKQIGLGTPIINRNNIICNEKNYKAVIKFYTYFGIPYNTVVVTCSSAYIQD